MAAEDDDDILESWEDAIDSEDLERRMEEREQQLNRETFTEETEMNSGGQIQILTSKNSTRTTYTPQIKILKRSNLNNVNQIKPKNKTEAELKQTLKLREAEYKAARNRIMGENYDETKAKLELEEAAKVSIVKNSERVSPQATIPTPIILQSPKIKILTASTNENIIRQPKGPDETKGFTLDR